MAATTSLAVLLVVLMCFDPMWSMTTNIPHHSHHSTREPTENDFALFEYDPVGNVLVVKQKEQCYFLPLNAAEQQIVHDSAGLRHLELRALQLVVSGTQEGMTGNDLMHIAHKTLTFCKTNYLTKLMA